MTIHELDRGLVTAPAGHGKTHSIARAVLEGGEKRPALVLTHTNAGVASIRRQLVSMRVPERRYRLDTIDAFSIRLIGHFPVRSGYGPMGQGRSLNYSAIRRAAADLVCASHLDGVIQANFSRLYVDEYQDCDPIQNALARAISKRIPTVVFGDPLQSIFDFAGPLATWSEVQAWFHQHVDLDVPWRWTQAGGDAALGEWLGEVRACLLSRQAIDLTAAPACVQLRLCGSQENPLRSQMAAARDAGRTASRVLIIDGDGRQAATWHRIARSVPGLIPVEPVGLDKSLIAFTRSLDLAAPDLVNVMADYVGGLMSGLDSCLDPARARMSERDVLSAGLSAPERAARTLDADRTHANALAFLVACRQATGTRVFRPEVLSLTEEALSETATGKAASLAEAGYRARERRRRRPGPVPRRAIGSTLLLKGLECDHAVLISAESMSARNLYVALTRARASITICTRSSTLCP